MKKFQRLSSFSYNDEPIYDTISDFDRTHVQSHSMSDIQRALFESNSFRGLKKERSIDASSVGSNDENPWQQYWDWYFNSTHLTALFSFHSIRSASHDDSFYCVFFFLVLLSCVHFVHSVCLCVIHT